MNEQRALILMTGSSGLLGTRVAQELSADYRIVGLDNTPPKQGDDHPAQWIDCDLTDDASVTQTMDAIADRYGRRIVSVIHLAAYYDFSGEPSPLYEELTVKGTRRLIDSLKDFDVEQFAFSSSLLVMEPVEATTGRLAESSDTRAEWQYPQSKLDAEEVIREHCDDIPYVILRLAGVYNEDGNSLPIGQHIKRVYEKQLEGYVFPGDADHGQPFVHLDDVARCFRQVVAKRKELSDSELFLIAEPDTMSHRELQNKLGELIHGESWPTIRIPKAVARAGAWIKDQLPGVDTFIKPWMIDLADDHYPVQIARARRRLGWEPQHRLRDTLEDMVRRMKRDPQAWFEHNGIDGSDDES